MAAMIKRNPVGFIGLFIALPALCLAVVPPLVIKPEPQKLTDTLLEEGANLARALLKGTPVEPPRDKRETTLRYFRIASVVMGLLAAFVGLFAWIRRENRRVCVSAMGVGVIAALWFYIIVAVVIAVIAVALLAFISEGV
jgi:hypothetical protein